MKNLTITIYIPLQEFEPYCYKIFEVINCLLQQQIYYYIKIFIKIFKVYCNKIFLQHKLITSNFIATLSINYCNDFDVIVTIFFVVINIFCCSDTLTLLHSLGLILLLPFSPIGLFFFFKIFTLTMTRLGRMAEAQNILNKNEGIINHILLLLFFIIFFFFL